MNEDGMYWTWTLFNLIWILCAVQGQVDEIREVVLCSNGTSNFTLSCENPLSSLPAFIDILEVPKLVFSEDVRVNGVSSCPTSALNVTPTCERQTSTPINRCQAKTHCQLEQAKISEGISFRRCRKDRFISIPMDGIITANMIIMKYSCFQVSEPRDIVLENSYIEREYSVQTNPVINVFSPGFPDSMSAEPQTFECVLERIPTQGVASDKPASIAFAIRHFVSTNQCDQRLNISGSDFCSTESNSVNFIARRHTARFEQQMSFTYEHKQMKTGGKLWLELKSNVSLRVRCNNNILTKDSTTVSTVREHTSQPIPLDPQVPKQNSDNKYYYMIGGGFVLLVIVLLACSLFALQKTKKKRVQDAAPNRNYNIYSETPPNRKLVRSRMFNTKMTDGNANVVPSQTKSTPSQKPNKSVYDRIKIGKMRWRLPNKKDQNYADIGPIKSDRKDNNKPKVHTKQPQKKNKFPSAVPALKNYQDPSTFVLQSSYENVNPQRSKNKAAIAADETVMVENSGVYESVETNA